MDFPCSKKEFSKIEKKVVAEYLRIREEQAKKHHDSVSQDIGKRIEVTGEKHLNILKKLFADIAEGAGFNRTEIFSEEELAIPGIFRPQKKWDFSIVRNGKLVAVIELKSQGSSFGNNFNNRIEESLGVAYDFNLAWKKKVFPYEHIPWTGYFMLLEKEEKTLSPVNLIESPLAVRKEFMAASYIRRYEIFLEHLMKYKVYSKAGMLVTTRTGIIDPVNDRISFYSFCKNLFDYLEEY